MAIRRVYIETTIPSFYHEARSEPDMVARRAWTRRWWDFHRSDYDLFSSAAVLEELERGDFASKQDAIVLLDSVTFFDIEEAIIEIVDTYIARKLMPADPRGDALHLAIASFHRCDFLVTWNCQHLANANKFDHVRRVNALLGLFVPALVTPLELLGEDDLQ